MRRIICHYRNTMKTHTQIVDEVHAAILKEWTSDELKEFFIGPWTGDRQLHSYNHSLGRYIRNNYDLWSIHWEAEIIDGVDHSPFHPDAVSMTLIEQVWKKGYHG